jgi:hypothetical protein
LSARKNKQVAPQKLLSTIDPVKSDMVTHDFYSHYRIVLRDFLHDEISRLAEYGLNGMKSGPPGFALLTVSA